MIMCKKDKFIQQLEKLCLRYLIIFNGRVAEHKPILVDLLECRPMYARRRRMNFVRAYRTLCLKQKYRLDCTLTDELVIIPLDKTVEAREFHFEELRENGFYYWRRATAVELQMQELLWNDKIES